MHNRIVVLPLTVGTVAALVIGLAGQGTAPERQLVTRAADALGGRDRVMAVKTLQIIGYGELAYFNGGGPLITVTLYHDTGSVLRYSYMFLGAFILLFGLHLPLLDRAEKKRKEFLLGGSAPPWFGPA